MPSRNTIEIILKAITGQARRELKGFSKEAQKSLVTLQNVSTVAIGLMTGFITRQALSAISSLADWAAANMEVADSFEALADRYNLDADRIVAALKRASKGTVSEQQLILQANKAMRLGVARTVEELEGLMKIAFVHAKDLGISLVEYWQRFNTAIASGYPLGLRQLGIVIDNKQAYEDWAAIIGKTTDKLTDQEEIQARVNAILDQGADDVERWGEAADTAADKTARLTAKTEEAKQAIGEAAAVIKGELSVAVLEGSTAADRLVRILEGGFQGAAEASRLLWEAMNTLDFRGFGIKVGAAFRVAMADAVGLTEQMERQRQLAGDLDIKFHDMAANIRDSAGAQDELGEATEEAANAAKRAEDIWHSYTTNVEEDNWRLTRRMEDLGFRQGQSAEDAAFRRHEIERSAAQSRGDLWDRFWLDERFETIRQHDQLKWLRQDYLDDLSDMEWDHLQEKRDMLDKSPWWIRQALQKEFKERERIAKTGDKDALRQFDEALKERIRVIDPIYAQELDRLEEQYQHEQEIEERESGQAKQRRQRDWQVRDREQEARLRLQLGQLERGLGNQLEAWRFHDQQRRENERWAMDRLISESGHQLDRMHSDTEWRLSRLPQLYKEYGYQSWKAFVQGQEQAQQEQFAQMVGPYPFPTAPFAFQQGAWEIPRRMMGILDRGEMVVPAGPAERMREGGGMTIEIGQLVVGAGYGPTQGRQFAKAVAEALGPEIRKQSR